MENISNQKPHQGIDNQIPDKYDKKDELQGSYKFDVRNIIRKDFLDGLLKSYKRAA